MKFKFLIIVLLFFNYVLANENIIDDPQLIYSSTKEENILDQKIIVKRKFNNINELASKINQFDGLTAKIKNQSEDKLNAVNVFIENGTVKDLLNKAAYKLGYKWNLINNSIIFTAISPLKEKTLVSENTRAISNIDKLKHEPQIKVEDLWKLDTKDKTLRNALAKWSKLAKWQLVWNSKVDYPITTNWEISGTFENAVNEILRASQETDSPLFANMHDSNKVLEIYSPGNNK